MGKDYEVFPMYEKGKSSPVIDADDIEGYVLLNGNGKIKKTGTVTDMDGYKVTVKDYMVINVEETD